MIEYIVIAPPPNQEQMTPEELEKWLNEIGNEGWRLSSINSGGSLIFWREGRANSSTVERAKVRRRMAGHVAKS